VAYTDIARDEIARNSFGSDIPSVLALTPSMVATNETGIGIGATSVRLRGTDATRLNVTINGVSMNNPDSHSMYWYDTPDLISSVGTVQVQRGAGISTNGTGAFGGAVNMTTEALPTDFNGSASLSYGSYNTNKQAVQVSSGLMGGHWAVDARLTHIGSDGYIDRGATDLKSYMFQGAYYNGNTMLKLVSFGGKAKTYLTYNGVTKEDMKRYGRRYHDSGQYVTSDGPFVLADGTHVDYYDDQTDNYLQINNQLILNHRIDDRWVMNATAFYTYGYGYYKQYKDDAWLAGYTNLQSDIEQADLIREKIMRNHLGGINASAAYSVRNLDLTFGGSWSYYSCPHWGTLDWVDGLKKSDIRGRWYDNDVDKQDANVFVRANWTVARGLRLFADMQYRYVHYQAWGVNDNYNWDTSAMQPIDVDKKYHFFNPRAGIHYTLADRHNFYASFAVAQKEPTRSDFTDRYMFSGDNSYPSSEKLYDYELGYRYDTPKFSAGVNLYYMKYKDQLVATGTATGGEGHRRREGGGQLPPGHRTFGTMESHGLVHAQRARNVQPEQDRGLHRRPQGQPYLRAEPGRHDHLLLARRNRRGALRLPLQGLRGRIPHAVCRQAVFHEQRNRRPVARQLLHDQPQPGLYAPHESRPQRPLRAHGLQPLRFGVLRQRVRLFLHGRRQAYGRRPLLPAGPAERAGQRDGEILRTDGLETRTANRRGRAGAALPVAGIPGRHPLVDRRAHHAAGARCTLLQGGAVCRLLDAGLLRTGRPLRVDRMA